MQYTTISFPTFGIELNPPRSFSIGTLEIHYYGILIALGLLLAAFYACRRSKQFGLKDDDLIDGVLWVTPFAIICARLYYCIFSWDEFAADPISVLYIWNGGLAIYGGVIGAAIGVVVYSKIKKIKLTTVLDMVCLGFLIGQCIGRWGNFFNREAFGAETGSFLRMGLLNGYTGEIAFYHPTFLYESLWNLAGFVLLHFLSKKRKYDGQIALGYLAWYGLGRTFIEGLRLDSLYWGSFRVSQMLGALSCFVAVAVLLWQWFLPHDPAKLYVNQVAAAAEASADEEVEETAEEAEEEPVAEETAAEEIPAENAEETQA